MRFLNRNLFHSLKWQLAITTNCKCFILERALVERLKAILRKLLSLKSYWWVECECVFVDSFLRVRARSGMRVRFCTCINKLACIIRNLPHKLWVSTKNADSRQAQFLACAEKAYFQYWAETARNPWIKRTAVKYFFKPLPQSEVWCSSFHMKMRFYSLANLSSKPRFDGEA